VEGRGGGGGRRGTLDEGRFKAIAKLELIIFARVHDPIDFINK